MSTRSGIVVLVAAAVLLVASCDRVTESVLGPVTTDTTDQTDEPDCHGDARTSEFAVDGFGREYGRYPVSQDELVGDWIRRSIDSHEIGADGEIVRRPGVPCSRNDPSDQEV